MLADELDFVVGVDPHRDSHALAIMRSGKGGRAAHGTTVQGYVIARRAARAS
jgi:hypothetical protein